jgi:hypothetical protein
MPAGLPAYTLPMRLSDPMGGAGVDSSPPADRFAAAIGRDPAAW